MPLKEKRMDVLERFQELILYPIDLVTAERASELRAKYGFLKTADALQLASALVNSRETFFTNDRELSAVNELEVLLLQDM